MAFLAAARRACLGISAGSMAYIAYATTRDTPGFDPKGKKMVELMPNETSFLISNFFPSTTTVTFYEGKAPIEYLEKRVGDMVQANPWLGSRLMRYKGRNVLAYESAENGNKSSSVGVSSSIFQVIDESSSAERITMDTPYSEMAASLGRCIVPMGCDILGKDEPVFKVTVVKDETAPGERFAVVTSLLHIAGDGCTFYAVRNMIGSNSDVVTLNPERNMDFGAAHKQAIGGGEDKDTYFWKILPAHIFEAAKCKLLRREDAVDVVGFHVNDAWVRQRKESHKEKLTQSKEDAKASSAPLTPFVSTNDILTSWWFNYAETTIGLMACNMRGKLPKNICDFNDAGNYEQEMLFCPADFETPSLVRHAVQNLRRSSSDPPTKLPTMWENMRRLRACYVTNWASFYKDNVLEGCTQRLHLPLYDWSHDKLAILAAGTKDLALPSLLSDSTGPADVRNPLEMKS